MSDPGQAPLVSILLPARNAADTLNPCLRSILRQTERRWECVLVDDGSDDETAQLARIGAAEDGRIRVHAAARAGLVAALNAGLERCRGEFVARMDADDLMHRNRLAEQVALLSGNAALAATGCHVRCFPRASVGPGLRDYESWINSIDGPAAVRREAFVECPVVHPTLMMRRDLLQQLGYRDKGWPEDYDLILRLLERGESIGMLCRRRLLWRHAPGRLSQSSEVYDHERFTECKADFLCRSFLAHTERYILWGHGATGRALRRALEQHGKQPAQIVEVHPRRLGNVIRGAEVISPEQLRTLPRAPLLVSVAGAGPRRKIREFLDRAGWSEGREFICTA
jgi:glycosyltransferase involved in cell wall biosynthesis